jgi:hypothetical protein
MNRRLGHAKRGSHTSLCMPHCKHYYLITPGDIVDVIASFLEQDTTRVRYRGLPIQTPDVWCAPKDVERRREFVGEQVR